MSETRFTPGPWEIRLGQWGYHGHREYDEDEWDDEEPIEAEDHEAARADNGGGWHLVLNPEANEREPGCIKVTALIDLYEDLVPGQRGYQECKATVRLISASPDLYAYAELEERAARLRDLEHEAYEEHKDWQSYHEAIWRLRDEIMPEFASQCPAPSEQEKRDWYGEEDAPRRSDADYREDYYGNESHHECSFGNLLHAKLTELRTAALAKARGEAVNAAL